MESSAQATTSDSASTSTATDITSTLNKGGEVVASKNGTKYYYPFCAAAQRLNPQSKITFSSEEAAKAAGYSAALNCSGMK
jgi:hypothetical protein